MPQYICMYHIHINSQRHPLSFQKWSTFQRLYLQAPRTKQRSGPATSRKHSINGSQRPQEIDLTDQHGRIGRADSYPCPLGTAPKMLVLENEDAWVRLKCALNTSRSVHFHHLIVHHGDHVTCCRHLPMHCGATWREEGIDQLWPDRHGS